MIWSDRSTERIQRKNKDKQRNQNVVCFNLVCFMLNFIYKIKCFIHNLNVWFSRTKKSIQKLVNTSMTSLFLCWCFWCKDELNYHLECRYLVNNQKKIKQQQQQHQHNNKKLKTNLCLKMFWERKLKFNKSNQWFYVLTFQRCIFTSCFGWKQTNDWIICNQMYW